MVDAEYVPILTTVTHVDTVEESFDLEVIVHSDGDILIQDPSMADNGIALMTVKALREIADLAEAALTLHEMGSDE